MKDLFEAAQVAAPIALRPTGQQLAEQGIFSAAQHADGQSPSWTEFAFDAIIQYARNHEYFTIEDLKAWAYLNGLPQPPAPGAWGTPTRRAAKEKVIVFDRFQESKSPGQHQKHVRVWRSTAAWQST